MATPFACARRIVASAARQAATMPVVLPHRARPSPPSPVPRRQAVAAAGIPGGRRHSATSEGRNTRNRTAPRPTHGPSGCARRRGHTRHHASLSRRELALRRQSFWCGPCRSRRSSSHHRFSPAQRAAGPRQLSISIDWRCVPEDGHISGRLHRRSGLHMRPSNMVAL
jgi:hypothetical protein